MNNRIRELALQAGLKWRVQPPHFTNTDNPVDFPISVNSDLEKFAELIVEEFRNVLADEYRKTPLECCGHFLRADETIAKHFYTDN